MFDIVFEDPDPTIQVSFYKGYSEVVSVHLLTVFYLVYGRYVDLMVSPLDSGLSGTDARPSRGTALCSWARRITLKVPLFTQVYKWVLANLLPGVTVRRTSFPSKGE